MLPNHENPQTPETFARAAPLATDERGFLDRRFCWILALLLLAALPLRLAILDEFLRENPLAEAPHSDGEIYWNMAGRMAEGKWLDDTPFLSAPLYPYLLGLIRTLGGDLTAAYLFQIVLHLLAAALLARGARPRFGSAAALLAAALFLLLAEPAFSVTRIMPNTLQVFLVTLFWAGWSTAARRDPPRTLPVLAAAALLGLLALAYPPSLLLIPIYALWICCAGKWRHPALLQAAAASVAAAIVIAPATLHNYLLHDEFVLISAHGGITLRQGNAPDLQGIGGVIPGISLRRDRMHLDAARQFQTIYGREGSWREIDRHYRRQVVDFWLHDPAAATALFAKKIYLYFSARNYDDLGPLVIERELGLADRAVLAPLAVPWLFGAACVGWIALLRRPLRSAPELTLWILPLLTVVLFFYCPRYRLPAVPFLCLTAAYALARWRTFRAPRPLTLALFCLPLPLWLVNLAGGIDTPGQVRDYHTRVISEAQALAGNRRAVRNELDDARRRYEQALELWPDNPLALRQIGWLHAAQGRFLDAENALVRAARLRPDDPFPRAQLYNVYCALERYPQAAAALRDFVRLRPRDFQTNLNLAWLLAACPDPAVREPREALRILEPLQPATPRAAFERLDALAVAHAALGDFEQAAKIAEEAARIADSEHATADADAIRRRLTGYRSEKPYLGPPPRQRGDRAAPKPGP